MSVAELKTNPEPTLFILVCCYLFHHSLCLLSTMITASEPLSHLNHCSVEAPTWWPENQDRCIAVIPLGMLQSLCLAISGTDEQEQFMAQPPYLPWPETRVSPCRGIHFACFLICWSNRVRSVGKAKITFKFPNSPRRLLSVYHVVTVPQLMYLFHSHSSECTEQGYTTKSSLQREILA